MTIGLTTTIRIPHKLWARMGDASISGMLAAKLSAGFPEVLIIEIEQTNMEYRRAHDGPAELIVPEYLMSCIMRDIVSL